MQLLAPLGGTVVALADVPDETFAAQLLGPGAAIEPEPDPGAAVRVLAPCAGRVVKVHPHAVALDAGPFGVIVHLGIDTVTLRGRGFEVLVADGQEVSAGAELIRWDVAVARGEGLAVVSPVVVLRPDVAVSLLVAPGGRVLPGDPLLAVEGV